MIDFSFLRFKNDFESAKYTRDSPVATHIYNDFIQLSPGETYCQITNIKDGISFESNYNAHLVDPCNNVLKDITQNVFIREFTDSNGVNQCIIEIVNIGQDFNRKAVSIRLTHTISDLVYWTNLINVTDFELEQTSFFQYKCYDDFAGIGYTNAQVYQSIRLKTYFDIPIDESEIESYYQISRERTISSRVQIKTFERYKIDQINNFTFLRLNRLLKSDVIYIDTLKVTDKTTLDSDDRIGDSNYFESNFVVARDYDDILEYSFQVFEGLNVVNYIPFGAYTQDNLSDAGFIEFNNPISLGAGNIYIYNSSNVLVDTQNVNTGDFSIVGNRIIGFNLTSLIAVNGDYYFNYDAGIVTFLGIENEVVNDSETWFITVQNGDYSNLDYSTDYLIN